MAEVLSLMAKTGGSILLDALQMGKKNDRVTFKVLCHRINHDDVPSRARFANWVDESKLRIKKKTCSEMV